MKRILHTILVAGIFAASLGLVACGDDPNEAAAPATSASTQATADTAAQAGVDAASVDVDAAALATPDIVVEYGDYHAMAKLAAELSQAAAKKSVVQVDGIVKAYGTSYSVLEESADGANRIGVMFVISGASTQEYPQDGARVRITGIVYADETGYTRFIATLPEYVQVVG